MPQARKACVMSNTPHASPPQKMARSALGELPLGEFMQVSFYRVADQYRPGKRQKVNLGFLLQCDLADGHGVTCDRTGDRDLDVVLLGEGINELLGLLVAGFVKLHDLLVVR